MDMNKLLKQYKKEIIIGVIVIVLLLVFYLVGVATGSNVDTGNYGLV